MHRRRLNIAPHDDAGHKPISDPSHCIASFFSFRLWADINKVLSRPHFVISLALYAICGRCTIVCPKHEKYEAEDAPGAPSEDFFWRDSRKDSQCLQ